MNIVLVTTTIHIPHVLSQYRAIGPDVEMIVAGDVSGPQDEIAAYCQSIGARYLSYEEQGRLGYAVHDIIGPRCIQRRNIALLEAIRSGADVVLTIDTDNAPDDERYFQDIEIALRQMPSSSRVVTKEAEGWFNPGSLAAQRHYYRGFPYSLRGSRAGNNYLSGNWTRSFSRLLPGIVNGLVLGDPDINATTRLEKAPEVRAYSGLYACHWIVTEPLTTWAPFNTQNTSALIQLAPLLACPPGLGRYDDIWASYIAQRVMQATRFAVLFGKPLVRQDRHEHNLFTDLKAELFGMEHTEAFCEILHAAPVNADASVLDNLAAVYGYLTQEATFLPEQTVRFMDAWLDDVARVL